MKILRLLSICLATCIISAQEHDHSSSAQVAHADHADSAQEGHNHEAMAMEGFLGSYSMSRESSGTAWQPEATPPQGVHWMARDWMLMAHGFAYAVYDYQGGRHGEDKWFSPNMAMLMAQHPLGAGNFGIRTMLSLEPATIGKSGYPELLQTGETADGVTPLIDRQHPHDLFTELAATYSHPITDDSTAFDYFGYPGEPALGPATFMHRFSGMDIPEAPHHPSLAGFDAHHLRRRNGRLHLEIHQN